MNKKFKATVVGMLSVGLVALGTGPAWASHKFTEPTNGVTCDEWGHTVPNGDLTYEGRCYGTPKGFSRGYRYREGQECDYSGTPAWIYGPWRSDGGWSHSDTCPGGSGVIAHKLTFQWV